MMLVAFMKREQNQFVGQTLYSFLEYFGKQFDPNVYQIDSNL